MARTSSIDNNPALTYTLDDFVSMQISDDMTYYNFSIIEKIDDVQHLDSNLVEIYIDILKDNCVEVKLSDSEYNKYRYKPDLLAYDLYGSVQLDFIILLLNDMYDPKEFIKYNIYLPYSTSLATFLNQIYSKESDYINQNRSLQGITS